MLLDQVIIAPTVRDPQQSGIQAINLTLSLNELNEAEKIITTSNIANALVNVTAPTQEPIFAQDINLAIKTLSTLNKYEQLISM